MTSFPALIERSVIEGKRDLLQNREGSPPRGVLQSRRMSLFFRLRRVAGYGIIGVRRSSSAHLHRPRRATSVQDWARQNPPFLRLKRRRACASLLQSICCIVGDRTCVTCRQIERSQDAGTAAVVPVVRRSDAGRRQAHGSRSDVVMSDVVDSGRESRHGNIDANDPKEIW